LVIVLAIIMVSPLFWALGLSIKSNAELAVDTHSVLHAPYTLQNYADILVGSNVFRWVMNSVIVSLTMTFGVLILSSLAGYGFARLESCCSASQCRNRP
jgi:multiple sugar transport system permease protein